jgi:hypothetical protein
VPSQVDPTPRSTTGRAADVVDVFVYVVVLNLFIEYVPAVISETFTLSLLTAVLLKGVLEVVVAVKKRAKGRFAAARSAVGRSAPGCSCGASSSAARSSCSRPSISSSATASASAGSCR